MAVRYLRVRPIGLIDAARLWFGYLCAGFSLLLVDRTKTGVGLFIPGKRLLSLEADGLYWHVRPRSHDLGLVLGTQEPEVLSWFMPRSGHTVVDIGAHIGCYSLRAARLRCTVIAIEPAVPSYNILRKNLQMNAFHSVIALQEAVRDKQGIGQISVHALGQTGSSSFQKRVSDQLQKVKVETLDSITEALRIDKIDWLKIDVEGDELKVLDGATRSLAITQKIIVEVGDATGASLTTRLNSQGFRLTKIQRQATVAYLLFERASHPKEMR